MTDLCVTLMHVDMLTQCVKESYAESLYLWLWNLKKEADCFWTVVYCVENVYDNWKIPCKCCWYSCTTTVKSMYRFYSDSSHCAKLCWNTNEVCRHNSLLYVSCFVSSEPSSGTFITNSENHMFVTCIMRNSKIHCVISLSSWFAIIVTFTVFPPGHNNVDVVQHEAVLSMYCYVVREMTTRGMP